MPEQIGFYVTVIRGQRVGWLAGPYATKEEAEGNVQAARNAAYEVDPATHWDAFGVTKLSRPDGGRPLPPGVLNNRLALQKVA
jgi:hypothetical protein